MINESMPKKILIIEDEESLVDLYRLKFEQEGFSVVTSSDGPAGLEAARKELPDLILLDILLPGMDGYQVLESLKKDENTKELDVFFLSNLVQNGEIKKGIEAGAKQYLIKSSLTPSQLVEKVKNYFNLDSAGQEANKLSGGSASAQPEPAIQAGGKTYKILLVEDNEQLIEMYLHQFIKQGLSVEVAKNGAWGLKLAKKIKFDAIILDMVMPALDGYGAIKKLREEMDTESIPIVILSNSAQDKDIEKAKRAGASAYFLKSSITPTQITKEIFKLLKQQNNDNSK